MRLDLSNPFGNFYAERMAVGNHSKSGLSGGNYSIPDPPKMSEIALRHSENVCSGQMHNLAGTMSDCSADKSEN